MNSLDIIIIPTSENNSCRYKELVSIIYLQYFLPFVSKNPYESKA